uniref:ATP synthase F0 subunit 8 n=1 Tax=Scutopus ventrolineatus TaxID=52922 RepID=A0A096XEB3_SCUVE|nr:ATP synthase F0 subunit 8 [Scutopus ventrolineatus]AHI45695.1 ATP synthase F0 subunit 8 [Scutopus ventrolineatus]
MPQLSPMSWCLFFLFLIILFLSIIISNWWVSAPSLSIKTPSLQKNYMYWKW